MVWYAGVGVHACMEIIYMYMYCYSGSQMLATSGELIAAGFSLWIKSGSGNEGDPHSADLGMTHVQH